MSKVFRPRRGKKSLMAGYKAGALILEEGEMFIEYPDSGVGTDPAGTGVGIKIGDGHSRYTDLPYYLQEQGQTTAVLEELIIKIDTILSNYENNLDALYAACVAEGSTPSTKSVEGISNAIAAIRNGGTASASDITSGKTAIVNKKLVTGTRAQTGTYTFPATYKSGTVDLGAQNSYRYVNAGNVYDNGRNQGRADLKKHKLYFSCGGFYASELPEVAMSVYLDGKQIGRIIGNNQMVMDFYTSYNNSYGANVR